MQILRQQHMHVSFIFLHLNFLHIYLHSLHLISLRSWRYGACEIKFWRRSREKYRLPENLGILNATHFYHLINLNWSQLNQPIRSDNFRAKYRRKRDRVTLCCCCWVHGGLRLQKPVKWRNTQDQEENANDFCRLCGVNLKIKFGALLWLISIARYLLLRDKIRRLLWTCFLLAFFIVTPRLAMIRTVCKYSR